MKKYRRLQGKNWHLVKNSFRLLYTYKSDNGNIKGIYTDGKTKISHWLNDEEKFEQLQQENKKLNGAIQTYDILLKANVEENKQLKDNWNKLKEYIKTEIPEDVFIDTEWFVAILDKMLELERGINDIKD